MPANSYTDLNTILAALGDYEILGHGFTVESGSATVLAVAFNGYNSDFVDIVAPAPGEDDLHPALEGRIKAPAEAIEGSTIDVEFTDPVDAEYFSGGTIQAYLFSEPRLLGSPQVTAGEFQVTLPAGVTGEHRLAVYDNDGWIIGWTAIAIGSASDQSGGPGTTAGTGAKSLAATGAEESRLPLAGLALAAAGAGALMLRRRHG
ncbi:MAG: hypothetical protein ACK5LO_15850 [Leucobacter sp.]